MWTAFDFLVAGGFVAFLALSAALIMRYGRSLYGRLGFALTAATGALLVVANGAVGLIGAETNPANLWYWGVVAFVLGGAIAGRFQASAMVVVALGAAVAQLGVAAAAMALGQTGGGEAAVKTWAVTALFCGLWGVAALAFRRAARQEFEALAQP